MSFDANTTPTTYSITTSPRSSLSVANHSAEGASGPRLGSKRQYCDIISNEETQNTNKIRLKAEKEAEKKRVKKHRKETRRTRYADQRQAAKLYQNFSKGEKLAGRGVTMCGWTMRADKDTVKVIREVRPAQADHKPQVSVFFDGLVSCKLGWVCPCCSIKKSEERRQNVNKALKEARKQGLYPIMLTLTARHARGHQLKTLLDQMRAAWDLFRKSRLFIEMNRDVFLGGYAKALEITHGKNGFHPHFHVFKMCSADSEAHAIELVEELQRHWLAALNKVGLDGESKAALTHSFQVQGAAEAKNYITKWGAAEEMTMTQTKKGKEKGLTPWQLLNLSRTSADEAERTRCARLWWIYTQATKSAHQLEASPKFKALYSEEQEEEQGEEPTRDDIGEISHSGWYNRARYRRLTIKEQGEEAPDVLSAKVAVFEAIANSITDADLLDDYDPGPLLE